MPHVARSLLALLVLAWASLVAAQPPGTDCPLPGSGEVDFTRYTGRWYEIGESSFVRNTIQRGCKCTEARYTLIGPGRVAVQNVCTNTSAGGSVAIALGTAVSLPSPGRPAGLGVSFSGVDSPFVNYIPVKIFGDYEQVLVGTPCFSIMWILARTPTIPYRRLKKIIHYAESVGFKPEKIGFQLADQLTCFNRLKAYPPVPPKTIEAGGQQQ
ncbi:Calycin-like protein [Entophlyctis helioformis]|nr:Calycin-like protein [Entophlyctis helioformis]